MADTSWVGPGNKTVQNPSHFCGHNLQYGRHRAREGRNYAGPRQTVAISVSLLPYCIYTTLHHFLCISLDEQQSITSHTPIP